MKIVRDTTRKSEKHERIRVASRTISCIISKVPAALNFLYNSAERERERIQIENSILQISVGKHSEMTFSTF